MSQCVNLFLLLTLYSQAPHEKLYYLDTLSGDAHFVRRHVKILGHPLGMDVTAQEDDHEDAEDGQTPGEDEETLFQAGAGVPVAGAGQMIADGRVHKTDVAARGAWKTKTSTRGSLRVDALRWVTLGDWVVVVVIVV